MRLKFKNDKERIAFLEGRRPEDGWYVWKEDDDLDRTMWRYDLPKAALICEQELRTFMWPQEHTTQNVIHWYVIRDWRQPFGDQVASRSLALAELKRCEKEAAHD